MLIRLRFQGYRCKSGIAIFKWKLRLESLACLIKTFLWEKIMKFLFVVHQSLKGVFTKIENPEFNSGLIATYFTLFYCVKFVGLKRKSNSGFSFSANTPFNDGCNRVQCPNLINLSPGLNLPKTGFNLAPA